MALNDLLVDFSESRIHKLIVSIPVRSGKSELCSGFFPAFHLGTHPDEMILLGGYNEEYAETWGGFARDVLERDGDRLYGIGVHRGSHKKKRWRIAGHRGQMNARGVGGGFPGIGGHKLVIDDPVKSPADAYSKLKSEAQWGWYQGIVRSRLEPGGGQMLVMSRWMKNDLAGRLMEHWDNEGEPYVHFWAPALAMPESDEMRRQHLIDRVPRQPGQALWPDRRPLAYDEVEYAKIRADVGPRAWWAQYQNMPSDIGGEFFKRSTFRYYTWHDGLKAFMLDDARIVPLRSCYIFQIVDVSSGKNEDSDYTVVGTFALQPARKELFVLDIYRNRIPGPEQIEVLAAKFKEFRPSKIRVEEVAYQSTLIQYAEQRGLPVEPIKPGRQSKAQRAEYIAIRYGQGSVFHPRRAAWLHDFEDELVDFPRGANDDQVDVMAYAGIQILEGGGFYGLAGAYHPAG